MTTGGMCCERCPGAEAADATHFARRRQLKAAVFQPQLVGPWRDPHAPAQRTRLRGTSAPLYRAVTGQIVDISPHFVTIGRSGREQRFALTCDARAWRGWPLAPSALWPGDEAVIRLVPSRPGVADRIWSNIGRVCGTIVERDADSMLVTESATRQRQIVVIPSRASTRIEVRFPHLRPGYLVDIIGLRRGEVLEGLVPATYQPPYPSDQLKPAGYAAGFTTDAISGSAVWHEPGDEPYGVLGLGYPAVDPSAGCAEDAAAGIAPGHEPAYRDLPYLAVGTFLHVRNECARVSWTLPVTGCAPTARLFNDHCATCRTSPRGRVADLTLASFVALGGEPEAGCFNATLTIGR